MLRSELVEIRRFVTGVDLVSNHSSSPSLSRRKKDPNRYVFKYSTLSILSAWTEIQMLSRLPPHPQLVLLDRLALDVKGVLVFLYAYITRDPVIRGCMLHMLDEKAYLDFSK